MLADFIDINGETPPPNNWTIRNYNLNIKEAANLCRKM